MSTEINGPEEKLTDGFEEEELEGDGAGDDIDLREVRGKGIPKEKLAGILADLEELDRR